MTEAQIQELFKKWLKSWEGIAGALSESEAATAEAAFMDAFHKGFQNGVAAGKES
jgi:hypothetical protein